jgi:hypothetical protein
MKRHFASKDAEAHLAPSRFIAEVISEKSRKRLMLFLAD